MTALLSRRHPHPHSLQEVVVEGPSARRPELLTGRTRQNKLVHFAPPPEGAPPAGTYGEVRVTDAAPHHLAGELVRSAVAPRRRVRIPVWRGAP